MSDALNTYELAKADAAITKLVEDLVVAKAYKAYVEETIATTKPMIAADTDTSDVKVEETPKPAKKKPTAKQKQAAAQAKNEADLEKVQAAADEAQANEESEEEVKQPAAAKLDSVYKQGSVNMMGVLSPLRALSAEARVPYLCSVEIDKTNHTDALNNGVMDLEMVEQAIELLGEKAPDAGTKLVKGHELLKSSIVRNAAKAIGQKLLVHMALRVEQDTLIADLQTLLDAQG